MGQLGDVLEVLFGPDDRYRTVRATIRHRLDRGLAKKVAFKARTVPVREEDDRGSGPGPPKYSTSTLAIWLSRPACARIERRREVDGGIQTSLTVTDGGRRWECDAEGHVETSDGEDRTRKASGCGVIDIDVDRHFNPGQIRLFFEQLILKPMGTVRTAGRDCVRLRAALRPGASLWPHWLPRGADAYEFDVDRERGALLNIVSRSGGEALDLREVLDVAFDEPLESHLFTYEPAPGAQVGPMIPPVEYLTLAAAVARMPFTVLVPTRVPDPEHSCFDVLFFPPRRQECWSHLTLRYHRSGAYRSLWIDEAARPDPGIHSHEWVQVDGESAVLKDLRISEDGPVAGMRRVAFEQQGTHVMIRSDLDRTRLIDLARSFVPAPRTTPV